MSPHSYLISGSWDQLVIDASATAHTYLSSAIRYIDEELGDGYAKKNPALIGQFMQVAGQDFVAALQVSAKQELFFRKLEDAEDARRDARRDAARKDAQ